MFISTLNLYGQHKHYWKTLWDRRFNTNYLNSPWSCTNSRLPPSYGYIPVTNLFLCFPGVEAFSYHPAYIIPNPSSRINASLSSIPSTSPTAQSSSPTLSPMEKQTPNSPATQHRRASTKWDAAGVNSGKSSIDVLLTWLIEEGNYSHY
jgi:hypothetical protein